MKSSIFISNNVSTLSCNYHLIIRFFGRYSKNTLLNKLYKELEKCNSILQAYLVMEHSRNNNDFFHFHCLIETNDFDNLLIELQKITKAKKTSVMNANTLVKMEVDITDIGFKDQEVNYDSIMINGSNFHVCVQPIIQKKNISVYCNKQTDWGINTFYWNKNGTTIN